MENATAPANTPASTLSSPASASLQEYVIANDWKPHARVLASTLVIPLGGSKDKRIFRVDNEEEVVVKPPAGGSEMTSYPRKHNPTKSIYTDKSPLPTLEKFVQEILACRGGMQGAIRAWSIEYGGPKSDIPVSITFQMCKNRYCELIGRSHKSNNIFWTILFDGWICLQGCHDPNCHGRGCPIPIRQDYLKWIQEEYQDWRDEDFEKALLSLNLEDVIVNSRKEDQQEEESDQRSNVQRKTTTTTTTTNAVDDGFDNGDFLSDEALLEAIKANPELFP